MELWVFVPNLYFYSGRTSNVMTIIFAYYNYAIHQGVPSNGGIVRASSLREKSEYFLVEGYEKTLIGLSVDPLRSVVGHFTQTTK